MTDEKTPEADPEQRQERFRDRLYRLKGVLAELDAVFAQGSGAYPMQQLFHVAIPSDKVWALAAEPRVEALDDRTDASRQIAGS